MTTRIILLLHRRRRLLPSSDELRHKVKADADADTDTDDDNDACRFFKIPRKLELQSFSGG